MKIDFFKIAQHVKRQIIEEQKKPNVIISGVYIELPEIEDTKVLVRVEKIEASTLPSHIEILTPEE